MVIEGFQGFALDLHDAGKSAGAWIAFEYFDPLTRLGEPESRRQTGETSANNGDIRIIHAGITGATSRIVA